MLHTFLDRLPIGWSLKFVLLRLASQWRSLITVIAGVVLAATIGANVPLYTSAVSQIGMVERLNQQPDELIHVFTRITYAVSDEIDYLHYWQQADHSVEALVDQYFDTEFPDWVMGVYTASESAPFIVESDEEPPVQFVQQRLRLAHYENWQDFVTLVEGNFPTNTTDTTIDAEAVVSVIVANEYELQVGDIVFLKEQNQQNSDPLRIRISGIVQETLLDDTYWINPSPLRIERSASQIETNLLLAQDDYVELLSERFIGLRTRISWRVLFDYTQLRFEQSAKTITALAQFEDGINDLFEGDPSESLSLIYTNEVIPTLQAYREEVSRLGAPFGLILLQIGAMVLMFLVVIVTLVRRGERREIAMLQSRGSRDSQILRVRGMEGLIIALFATLISPWIARQILVILVPALVGVERLRLSLTPTVYVFAAFAAFAAFVVLFFSIRPILRLPLISAGGSALRGETQAWWQKYYLDVLLMLFGLLGLWRLLASNSALVETNSGVARADPLLLLTPAILFIAIGSLLLRLFPTLMRFITALLASRSGLGGLLAGWQVSREPLHYARITFLLALAIGVGWFATSFQATIVRSQADQARYRVGSDLRITEYDTQTTRISARPEGDFFAIDDVEAITQLRRFENVGVAINTVSFQSGEVLAINHDTLADTAFWRGDLGELFDPVDPENPLPEPSEFGYTFPTQPAKIGLWANMPQPLYLNEGDEAPFYATSLIPFVNSTNLSATFLDETNTVFSIPLYIHEIEGVDDLSRFRELFSRLAQPSDEDQEERNNLVNQSSGWVYFEGDFTDTDYTPVGELRLISVNVVYIHQYSFANIDNLNMYLADLAIITADGEIIQTDILHSDEIILTGSGDETTLQMSIQESPNPSRSINRLIEWHPEESVTDLRLLVNYPDTRQLAIPAVVSNSFLELNNLTVGLNFTMLIDQLYFNFHIIGATDYYPTLYQEERPFVIVDLNTLQDVANQRIGEVYSPNETWIKLADGASEDDVIQTLQLTGNRYRLETVQTVSETLENFETDPLSLGLIGLLFLSFIIVLVLSIISLLTYAGLTAQFRRSEFGVLRALGVSSTRLILSLALEQVMVIIVALVIGALIGMVLSTQVLPTLATSITTRMIAPPFIVQTEIEALFQYGLVIVMIILLVLVFTLLLVRQLSLAQAIKLGEE